MINLKAKINEGIVYSALVATLFSPVIYARVQAHTSGFVSAYNHAVENQDRNFRVQLLEQITNWRTSGLNIDEIVERLGHYEKR
jgi:hypothetical protein